MNDAIGKSMRFCETCGVAMGLMTRCEYIERFVHHAGKCPVCGKRAWKRSEEEKEVWIGWTTARAIYHIPARVRFSGLAAPHKMEGGRKLVLESSLAVYGRRYD